MNSLALQDFSFSKSVLFTCDVLCKLLIFLRFYLKTFITIKDRPCGKGQDFAPIFSNKTGGGKFLADKLLMMN